MWTESYPVRTEIVDVNDSIDSPRSITITASHLSPEYAHTPPTTAKMGNKVSSQNSTPSVNGDLNSMYFSEIRSFKRIYKVEESIGTENIDVELRGIDRPS